MRALTFEGLTVAAVGLVGNDLRFACAVPVELPGGGVFACGDAGYSVLRGSPHLYRVC